MKRLAISLSTVRCVLLISGQLQLNYLHRWVGQLIFVSTLFHVVSYRTYHMDFAATSSNPFTLFSGEMDRRPYSEGLHINTCPCMGLGRFGSRFPTRHRQSSFHKEQVLHAVLLLPFGGINDSSHRCESFPSDFFRRIINRVKCIRYHTTLLKPSATLFPPSPSTR
jgi:hypothetical protein